MQVKEEMVRRARLDTGTGKRRVYSGKYALSHLVYCAHCGDIFRRTQTEVAEKVGVSLAYVNRIIKGREQIVNKTFVKMMDELGYDVELTYKKKAAE